MEVLNMGHMTKRSCKFPKPMDLHHNPKTSYFRGPSNFRGAVSPWWQQWGRIHPHLGSSHPMEKAYGHSKNPLTGDRFSLWQVLLPKLCYPLMATNFSESQWKEIMQPVLSQGLPAPSQLALPSHSGIWIPHIPRIQPSQSVHGATYNTCPITLIKYGSQPGDLTGVLCMPVVNYCVWKQKLEDSCFTSPHTYDHV